jgi:hypothetical protein
MGSHFNQAISIWGGKRREERCFCVGALSKPTTAGDALRRSPLIGAQIPHDPAPDPHRTQSLGREWSITLGPCMIDRRTSFGATLYKSADKARLLKTDAVPLIKSNVNLRVQHA